MRTLLQIFAIICLGVACVALWLGDPLASLGLVLVGAGGIIQARLLRRREVA